LQDEGAISFNQAADNVSILLSLNIQAPEFTSDWAKRPKIGQMYETKYIEPYREIIESFYNLEEADKRNKKVRRKC
jgi:hypothetical protein